MEQSDDVSYARVQFASAYSDGQGVDFALAAGFFGESDGLFEGEG